MTKDECINQAGLDYLPLVTGSGPVAASFTFRVSPKEQSILVLLSSPKI